MVKKLKENAVRGSTRRNVEILLAEKVPALGKPGEIVRVKPGYARNYLLPYGKATIATEENKQMVEEHKKRIEELELSRIHAYRKLADSVSKYSVTLEANANDEGHLYGSIVSNDISDALKATGYQVEPDHIKLDGHLKELGMYTVKLAVHPEVLSEVKVWVVPSTSAN